MKKIIVIDNRENADKWKSIYKNADVHETITNFEAELYIVCLRKNWDEFADNVKVLKAFSRHVIAVTSDTCLDTQSKICSLNVDDIIFSPVCGELLLKKIKTITERVSVSYNEDINFGSFIDFEENNFGNGAFFVRQDNFESIYKFVLRLLERLEKSSQALIFTINETNSDDELHETLDLLSNAVQICLRRGDIFSVNNSNQVLIILMGADDDGGHLVANRILSNFYSLCDSDTCVISYDMRKIIPQNA